MFRLTVFIIALLLLAGEIEPSKNWFIALAVVSGLSLFMSRPLGWFGWFGRFPPWARLPLAEGGCEGRARSPYAVTRYRPGIIRRANRRARQSRPLDQEPHPE